MLRFVSTAVGSVFSIALMGLMMRFNAQRLVNYIDPASLLFVGLAGCVWLMSRLGQSPRAKEIVHCLNASLALVLVTGALSLLGHLGQAAQMGAALALLMLTPLYLLISRLLVEPALNAQQLSALSEQSTNRTLSSSDAIDLGLWSTAVMLVIALSTFVLLLLDNTNHALAPDIHNTEITQESELFQEESLNQEKIEQNHESESKP